VIRAEIPGSDLAAREAEIERIYLGGVDEMLEGVSGSSSSDGVSE
jgi:hypothetical protein